MMLYIQLYAVSSTNTTEVAPLLQQPFPLPFPLPPPRIATTTSSGLAAKDIMCHSGAIVQTHGEVGVVYPKRNRPNLILYLVWVES